MSFPRRTINCGSARIEHAGERVTLNGWAHKVRDLGGLLFIDLRDRTGIVQLLLNPDQAGRLPDIKPESCLAAVGFVRERAGDTKNPNMHTGDVEVVVDELTVLNAAGTLPFPVSDEKQMEQVGEELRLKHRYLDLRRPSMLRKLEVRAYCVTHIRRFLDEHGFLEVETPIITRSTPEGARDYLVPYRLEPGKFYALPQSPQQYKQLLMAAGVERYYQIAKCFRDEAQRADRQPEFTQLDLEISFTTQEEILSITEELTIEVCNGAIKRFDLDKEPVEPFERLTYQEAKDRYGTDKPDTRFGLELFDVSEAVQGSEFGVFAGSVEKGGRVRGVRYPGGAELSRKEISEIEEMCKGNGAKGLATLAVIAEPADGSKQIGSLHVKSGIVKFLSDAELQAIVGAAKAEQGDLICMVADTRSVCDDALSRLRNVIGDRCGMRDPRVLKFVYVVDFPLVDWNEEESRWDPTHHPFTSPKHEDMALLEEEPGRVRADCYDIVCNGVEWASGSIRIHNAELQSRVFSLIGVSEEQQRARFGHMLEAFRLGCPPHGGIAPGIDRLAMLLTGEENIREVIAFPKMGGGYDPLMDAPSRVDRAQWQEMGLRLSGNEKPGSP